MYLFINLARSRVKMG